MAARIGIRSCRIRTIFPSVVRAAMTTACFRRATVHERGSDRAGLRTLSVTTSTFLSRKCVLLEMVSHPSRSEIGPLPFTPEDYGERRQKRIVFPVAAVYDRRRIS